MKNILLIVKNKLNFAIKFALYCTITYLCTCPKEYNFERALFYLVLSSDAMEKRNDFKLAERRNEDI